MSTTADPQDALGEHSERPSLPTTPPTQTALNATTGYQVRVVYMVPSNRSVQPQAEQTLQSYVLRMHAWTADHMERLGFARKGFTFETEADGVTPLINLAFVAEPDTNFHGDFLERWNRIRAGIANVGFPTFQRGEILLVVAETHVQLPDGSLLEDSVFFGGAGVAGSGVGIVTGETLARMPAAYLTDDRNYDGLVFPAIGPFPLVQGVSFPGFEGATVSSTSSSAQGGAFHELGHAFGLRHDFRNERSFNGNLMGNGLRGIRGAQHPMRYPADDTRLSTASAHTLNTHRFFNPGRTFAEDFGPNVSVASTGLITPRNGLCGLEFTASDTTGLASALLMRGGQVVADTALSGTSVTTQLETYNYQPGVADQWRLVVYDTEGNNMIHGPIAATCEAGHNRAPVPMIAIDTTTVTVGEPIVLDASASNDPDGDSALLNAEWDLDGDGVFDTQPTTVRTLTQHYTNPGVFVVRARLTDEQGAFGVSQPIGVRVLAGTTAVIADAVVPVKDSRRHLLFDGQLASAWSNGGDPAANWFELLLTEHSTLTKLLIAARPNRALRFRVLVDGSEAGTYTTPVTVARVLHAFDLPAGTAGSVVRIETIDQSWLKVHEVALQSSTADTQLPVASVIVPVKSARAPRIADGDLDTQWTNNGDPATAWIEAHLDGAHALSNVQLATWPGRTTPVRIYVDDVLAAEHRLAALPDITLQDIQLPVGTAGSRVGVQSAGRKWLRLHELTVSGRR